MSDTPKDKDLSLYKVPPQNVQAEESILSAIMIDNNTLHEVVDVLAQGDDDRDDRGRDPEKTRLGRRDEYGFHRLSVAPFSCETSPVCLSKPCGSD